MLKNIEEDRRLYVDTSLIVARYKPGDELHEAAEKLFKQSSVFYASYLTVVELHAVLSRIWDELVLPQISGIDVSTLTAFMVKDCGLRLVPRLYSVSVDFHGQRIRMPLEYYLAVKHAAQIGLRALDLLHICHAAVLKQFYNVQTMVTGDEELIAKSNRINKLFKIRVQHPRNLL